MTEHLNYNVDVHNDCTPCPNREGKKCDLIGTGVHESIRSHLLGHGWSEAKIEGITLGAMLCGRGDLEILNMAHDAILLFQPREGVAYSGLLMGDAGGPNTSGT